MVIEPFFGINSWITSTVYFVSVLFFVLNRSKILTVVGKYLTPIIFIVILSIISIGIFSTHAITIDASQFQNPVISGVLEGYQTFDAIGAVVIGGVIIVSLQIKGRLSFEQNRMAIVRSGIIAGIGLFVIYSGMIYIGASYISSFDTNITRTDLLSGLSLKTLGTVGRSSNKNVLKAH